MDCYEVGRTTLVIMDTNAGDSPPICQKPYIFPLKHADCVQKDLQTPEMAGDIVRSLSP